MKKDEIQFSTVCWQITISDVIYALKVRRICLISAVIILWVSLK